MIAKSECIKKICKKNEGSNVINFLVQKPQKSSPNPREEVAREPLAPQMDHQTVIVSRSEARLYFTPPPKKKKRSMVNPTIKSLSK